MQLQVASTTLSALTDICHFPRTVTVALEILGTISIECFSDLEIYSSHPSSLVAVSTPAIAPAYGDTTNSKGIDQHRYRQLRQETVRLYARSATHSAAMGLVVL
jgi:hypothetical protein